MYENERKRTPSTVVTAEESKANNNESIFKRMLRFVFPDQRKQARYSGPPLIGYLGTMWGSRPFEVGDVGLGGFTLVTEERWLPGTEMPVTLKRMNVAEGEPEDQFTVQAMAVRWTEDGVAFSIVLFEEDSVAVSDNPVHVAWASRQEMKMFLARLKGPEEMRAMGLDSQARTQRVNVPLHVSPHTAGD